MKKLFRRLKASTYLLIILLNILIIAGAFFLYAQYISLYRDSLWHENLDSIASINQATYLKAITLFENWDVRLNDIAQYAETNQLTYEETLTLIYDLNSTQDHYFELLGSDFTGHLARKDESGTFIPVSYTNGAYLPQQEAMKTATENRDAITFLPEFTESSSGAPFFAICRCVLLQNDSEEPSSYTLLLAARSSAVVRNINFQINYNGQSSVLIDETGTYIIKSTDFSSNNLFDYIAARNNLSRDQKNALCDEMQRNDVGEFFYRNSVTDAVFSYAKVPNSNWYCVTCVPLSSFGDAKVSTVNMIFAVLLLILLLIIDTVWMQLTNRRLRRSVANEMRANAAKGNFMSRMSHEIRTPLNAVIGYNSIAVDALAEAKNDLQRRQAETKVMDCLVKSEIASKHLLTVINDVLDMSAIESGKLKIANERFDFKSLVYSLTTIFYSQAKTKNLHFDVLFDSPTEEWYIGDQLRVKQVLTNLLSNAIKFTPERGSVKMTIRQIEADDNTARVSFTIADTGIGMTPEFLERLWIPFEQADSSISRRFGGTGLGMTITKNMVDLMGGTITAESTVGVGTTFHLELTFTRAKQSEEEATFDFKNIRALIVDDDKSACDYISLLFERCGVRCLAVTGGSAALDAFARAEQAGDGFNLCLVDWKMPEMDGIETIRRLRDSSKQEIPIIVITAYDYTEVADQAATLGVTSFLEKPLFQSSVFNTLANLYGKRTTPIKAPEKTHNFTGSRVLLTEDNTMNMEIAKRVLMNVGFEVDEAWNGAEAVEKFENAPSGTYQAILMDVQMPIMDGHTASRTIRACAHPEAKTIPIIAMTADAFVENIQEAKQAGMNDHISKPINLRVLFDTLRKYIPS